MTDTFQSNRFVGESITSVGSTTGTPTLVPANRYYSEEFAQAERDKLWPRVWLLACSLDHVANPGDFFEYRLNEISVVITRDRNGELHAFQNVCSHRGNMLCTGAGSGLSNIRCPYHGWTYSLNGALRGVPSREGFGEIDLGPLALSPVKVDTWGELVFINLDNDAMELHEYLHPMPEHSAWLGLNNYRCQAMVRVKAPANWKVVVDGFSETYHIQMLHREMMPSFDDVNSPQEIWGHTTLCVQHFGVPSPRVANAEPEQVWNSFVLNMGGRVNAKPGDSVPELADGQEMRDVLVSRIRDVQTEQGNDVSHFSDDQLIDIAQYNFFPNSAMIISPDIFQVWSVTPGTTTGTSEFFILSMNRVASPDEPRKQPPIIDMEYGDTEPLGLILNQDLGILRRTQQGLQQPGFTHMSLSSEEARIINTHRQLERYLEIEPSELTGGPTFG